MIFVCDLYFPNGGFQHGAVAASRLGRFPTFLSAMSLQSGTRVINRPSLGARSCDFHGTPASAKCHGLHDCVCEEMTFKFPFSNFTEVAKKTHQAYTYRHYLHGGLCTNEPMISGGRNWSYSRNFKGRLQR